MALALDSSPRSGARPAPSFGAKLIAAAVLAAAADFLFWERQVGISAAVFALLLATALAATAVPWTKLSRLVGPTGVLLAGLLPLVENVSLLSISIGVTASAAFALAATGRLRRGVNRAARQIFGFLVAAPFRLIPDMTRWRQVGRKLGGRPRLAWLAAWIVPVGLGAVFVALIGIANPVVELWLEMIELWRIFELFEARRVAFWLLVLATAWGFLRPRISWFQRRRQLPGSVGPVRPQPAAGPRPLSGAILGERAILRALVVFNLIFAVETALDIAYLWGGVALPEGMTYAAYAHRGAYPLIVTALLAAGFVLVAMRQGSEAAGSRPIRALVYLWTAQNVMLVVSSILRLDLYVSVYSLTYWRVAAFIWMGLVAAGLVLIVCRIALGKSNGWLFSANLLTLSATLYACGFVNFAAMIAGYNVDHRPQPGDASVHLDTCYLAGLGPQAIPAIDRLLAEDRSSLAAEATYLARARAELGAVHAEYMQDWRAWTFRGRRLMRYLENPPIHERGDGLRER